ncbi:hypothetical protein EYV94_20720 [Puteibacter caeruleilacunae]|nr:hypothetical protein EYV94_20720 [Puteibacter caeruleilacunae]
MDTNKKNELGEEEKVMKKNLPMIYEATKMPAFKIIVDEEAYCVLTLNGKKAYPNFINELQEEMKMFIVEATPFKQKRINDSELEHMINYLKNYRRRNKDRKAHVPMHYSLVNTKGKGVNLKNQSEHVVEEVESFFNYFFSFIVLLKKELKFNLKCRQELAVKEPKFKLGDCYRDATAYMGGMYYSNSIKLVEESRCNRTNATTFVNEMIKELRLDDIPNVSKIFSQITQRSIDDWALWYGEFTLLFHDLFPRGKDFETKEKRNEALLLKQELKPVVWTVYDVITNFVRIVRSHSAVYPSTIFPWLEDKIEFDRFLKRRRAYSIIYSMMVINGLKI